MTTIQDPYHIPGWLHTAWTNHHSVAMYVDGPGERIQRAISRYAHTTYHTRPDAPYGDTDIIEYEDIIEVIASIQPQRTATETPVLIFHVHGGRTIGWYSAIEHMATLHNVYVIFWQTTGEEYLPIEIPSITVRDILYPSTP